MDILIFTNFHPLLSSKMTKNAETAKICPNKAGHMETMAKNFIFEVKTVAKWLQKPKNRRAIFAGRGSWTWGSKSKRPQIQRLSPLCHGSITENPCWKSNLWTARPPFRRLCPRWGPFWVEKRFSPNRFRACFRPFRAVWEQLFFSTNFGSRAFGLRFWRLAGPFQLLMNVLYDLLSVARWISRRLSKNTFPRYNFGRFSDSHAFSIRFGRLASSSQMLIDVLYNLFSVAVRLVRCR